MKRQALSWAGNLLVNSVKAPPQKTFVPREIIETEIKGLI
jgi:hypothetical protein